MEYIQGTGTQYIDTGVSAPQGFKAFVKMEWTTPETDKFVIGSHNTGSPYGRNGLSSYVTNKNKWQLSTGNAYPGGGTLFSGIIYNCEVCTYRGESYLNINGTRVINSTDNQVRSSLNLLFFTSQYAIYMRQSKSKFRLLEATIYDHLGNLVRDYAPKLRVQDSKPGLYDFVTELFYTNAGTGEFLYN